MQQLYTRLILQDKPQFLFSPYSSGLSATAAVITEQYGKIMLTSGGAEGKTYQLGNKYLFQCITPADQYLSGAHCRRSRRKPAAPRSRSSIRTIPSPRRWSRQRATHARSGRLQGSAGRGLSGLDH